VLTSVGPYRVLEKITPLVDTPFHDSTPALSPDEQWLAYSSDQTGRREVYVRALSGNDGRWQVSTQGGTMPRWRRDGRELYFLTLQNRLMAVSLDPGDAFRHGPPQPLFTALFNDWRDEYAGVYAPMPDGQHFVADIAKERTTTYLTIVTNWAAGR
jgi:eukaryotic-like serine/threonine-protein kinase